MKTNTPMDDRIPEYISQIRMYINKPRRKYALMQDSKAYNQLCSSLDCIGDTYMALVSYLNSDFPHEVGLRYIYLYGLLQVLFVQQDASKDMSTSLKIQIINNKDLNKIRNIRHDSIGHPTNRGNGKSFHFISRMSITKESFTLLSFPTNSKPKFETIDIVDLIKKQIKCLNLMFRNIIKQLEENEIKHKEKYNNEKLTSLFPQTTDYYFQKMFEVIYTHSQHEHGLGCLELFEDNYKKLILKLKEMGEYPSNEVLVYEIGEVLYPIQKIKSFYKNEKDNTLNEKDASIFITFIVQQHSKILTLLEEIDQDYRSCNK